jgi:hypothetical protein
MELSEQKELEKMQAKRAELEKEARSLKEEQKKLERRILLLEEKLVVENLQNNNKATKDVISQLEARLSELKGKLKQKPQVLESPAQPKETKTKGSISPEKAEEAPEVPEPPKSPEPTEAEAVLEVSEEESITVTAIDDEALIEIQDSRSDKQEKKKHRFF